MTAALRRNAGVLAGWPENVSLSAMLHQMTDSSNATVALGSGGTPLRQPP